MNHPIIEDTQLQCNQGTSKTPIKVTSQQFAKIAGKRQATEQDKEANTNIIPFGTCKLKPAAAGYLPCVPELIQWQKTSLFSIDGKKELTTASFCMCNTGGKVTPLMPSGSSFETLHDT